MSEDTGSQQQQPQADESPVTVRHVVLMEVCRANEVSAEKRKLVVLTMGTPEGDIEYLAFTEPEAMKILGRLAYLFREPWKAAPGAQRWCVPHSIGRAGLDLNADGIEKCLTKLIRDIPEVGEFVERELQYIRRRLERNIKSKRVAKELVQRVSRSMLLAVDAARADT